MQVRKTGGAKNGCKNYYTYYDDKKQQAPEVSRDLLFYRCKEAV